MPVAAETPTPAALKGFLARVGSGAMRARTRIDGLLRFQVPVSGLDTSIRIAASRHRVAYNAGSTKYITVKAVRGGVHIGSARAGWSVLPTGAKNGNPFGKLTAREVTYRGPKAVRGKRLHHLVIAPTQITDALGTRGVITQLIPDFASIDVLVAGNGVPVSARVRFRGSGAYQGITVELDADYQYTFAGIR